MLGSLGHIDEQALDNLSLVVNLAKYIDARSEYFVKVLLIYCIVKRVKMVQVIFQHFSHSSYGY